MKIPKEVVILILITGALPFARAIVLPQNCSHLSEWRLEECQNILGDQSISLEEKEDLYLNLIANQGKLPAHDFAWNWNEKLSWENPSGVVSKSKGIIKKAWTKIVGANKSFYDFDSEEWFFSPKGKILVEKNYSIELPQLPLPGDCRTNYSYELLENSFSINLNGFGIGSAKISNYNTGLGDGQAMLFSSNLNVKTRLRIDRFHSVTECLIPELWWTCITSCVYYKTDYREDSVSVSDSFKGKTRIEEIEFKGFVERGALNKIRLTINSNHELNFFELRFGEKRFGVGGSVFDLGTTASGTVFVTRKNKQQKKLHGLVELDSSVEDLREFVLGTTSTENCSIKIFNSFEEKNLECGLVELKPVQLTIETNSNHFDFNQEVGVRIKLSDGLGTTLANKKITLQSKQEIKLITNANGVVETIIPASESNGVIVAKFAGNDEFASAQTVKRVALSDSKALGTTEQAAGFFGAYYFLYLIGKKILVGV